MIRYIFFILFLASLPANADRPWKLEKEADGIKVYTREKDGSDIKEFKAVALCSCSRTSLEKILINVNKFVEWFPDIIESHILREIGPDEYYIYYAVDIPWPADNRDATMRMKMVRSEEKKTTTIYHTAVSGVKDHVDGYVRMSEGKGFWNLTDSGSQTRIAYQFHSNPGGSLPTWMINMFIVDNPFNTVKALMERAGQ